MKTFLVSFIQMGSGETFEQRIIAEDEDHAHSKAREIEIDEAASILTIEED